MKNIIFAFALYLVLALPLSAATTLKGKVGSSGEKVWAFVPQGDGQTTVTLTWSKKNADMFVALDCTVDGELISFGLGAAAQDRMTLREMGATVGVLPPGALNAITDVPGVRVGQGTLIEGDSINTGVTAVLPLPVPETTNSADVL